jgi:Holin of 3TMs, for gene-transfer release
MDWKDLQGVVSKAAPLLGTLLGGPAGGAVGAIISSVLGVENKPDEVHKALSADPSLLLKLREAEIQQQTQLQQMTVESEIKRLSEVNATMRAELASGDRFKSYWRPLFGYVMALTWGAMMLATTYQILFDPSAAAATIQALGQLSALWGIGLAVLGINVYKRSDDKALIFGKSPDGIMSAVAARIKGKTDQ